MLPVKRSAAILDDEILALTGVLMGGYSLLQRLAEGYGWYSCP